MSDPLCETSERIFAARIFEHELSDSLLPLNLRRTTTEFAASGPRKTKKLSLIENAVGKVAATRVYNMLSNSGAIVRNRN